MAFVKIRMTAVKEYNGVYSLQCTEVRFASFPSSGFITAIVVNPPERKLAKTHLCAMQIFAQMFDQGSFFADLT